MIGSDDIRVFVLLLFKDSPWYQWKDTQRLQRTHTVKYSPHQPTCHAWSFHMSVLLYQFLDDNETSIG